MQKNVIEYLSRTAGLYPDKTAVVDADGSISFRELEGAAIKVARSLHDGGVSHSPVCVFLQKGCAMVEAFAGISASGNFYVPLDTKSPRSRVLSILDVLSPAVVITDSSHEQELRSFCDRKILVIEDALTAAVPDGAGLTAYTSGQIDTDPVYSIFTSGSTGVPKGVVVTHRGVIDYIDWAVETFGIDSSAVIGNQAPFYFDNSTLDIYLMYSVGATLDIIPESSFAFPARLVDYLDVHRITFVFWVPFVLVNVANFDIFSARKPHFLRDVFFAGEVMPNKHLNYWRKHLPECRYANLYGPTEITVDCTYYVVDREFTDDEPLPIGVPCRNSGVMILVDRARRAVPGEQGELCVRGSSLAAGYFNNPEKTRRAFIQNPLQQNYPELIYCTGDIVYENERGEIMYVGRADSQIKHNGYRIELGEIETAVLGSGMVENCCVVYDFVNKKIVLFYQSVEALDMAAFRRAVMTRIPRYMIPADCHREERLKQNGSGKIDRAYYNGLINK